MAGDIYYAFLYARNVTSAPIGSMARAIHVRAILTGYVSKKRFLSLSDSGKGNIEQHSGILCLIFISIDRPFV